MWMQTALSLALVLPSGVAAFEQAVDQYIIHKGFILGKHEDIMQKDMTPADARLKCASMPNCAGFTFKGEKANKNTTVYFKSVFEVHKPSEVVAAEDGWYSYQRKGLYSKHKGHVSGKVPDLHTEVMLVSQAEEKCDRLANCYSFCYRSAKAGSEAVEVFFKGSSDVSYDEDDASSDWVTHRRMSLYSVHTGHVSGRYPDIESGDYTIEAAQAKCLTLPGCRGFTFEGPLTDVAQQKVPVHFKRNVDVEHGDGGDSDKWITYRRMGLFTKHYGHISGNAPDLMQEEVTIHDAQIKCLSMPECRGFTFKGRPTEDPVLVFFKNNGKVEEADGEDSEWMSFRRTGLYSHQSGHISGNAKTLLVEKMTKPEAVAKCDSLPSCRGFTYQRNQGARVYNGEGEEASELEIHFKDRADWHLFDPNSDWDSWHRDDLGYMSQADEKLMPSTKKKFLQPSAPKPPSGTVGEVGFESNSISEF
jgi:hypothetical protein